MPRRKPLPKSEVPRALVWAWRNYAKTRNWVLGAGSSLLIIVGVGAWAAPYAEAITPVTHSYARSEIIPRIITAQLDANAERRERLLSESKGRELELQSPGATVTPQYRALVQDRLDANKKALEELDKKDKALSDEKTGGKK